METEYFWSSTSQNRSKAATSKRGSASGKTEWWQALPAKPNASQQEVENSGPLLPQKVEKRLNGGESDMAGCSSSSTISPTANCKPNVSMAATSFGSSIKPALPVTFTPTASSLASSMSSFHTSWADLVEASSGLSKPTSKPTSKSGMTLLQSSIPCPSSPSPSPSPSPSSSPSPSVSPQPGLARSSTQAQSAHPERLPDHNSVNPSVQSALSFPQAQEDQLEFVLADSEGLIPNRIIYVRGRRAAIVSVDYPLVYFRMMGPVGASLLQGPPASPMPVGLTGLGGPTLHRSFTADPHLFHFLRERGTDLSARWEFLGGFECENCEDSQASHYCGLCRVYLCQTCDTGIHRPLELSSHVRKPVLPATST